MYLGQAFADGRDVNDAVPESVVGALREVNEIAQRNIALDVGAQPMNLSRVQPNNLATFVPR